jgi:hypothetical protein
MKLVLYVMQSKVTHICTYFTPPSKVACQHGGRTNFIGGNNISGIWPELATCKALKS